MKRCSTLMLLALIATCTFAQPREIKRTDRLLAASGIPRGDDKTINFIETFQYEGNIEAIRWRTDYYAPKKPRNYWKLKDSDRKQVRYKKKLGKYWQKKDVMLDKLPRKNWHLFLAAPSFEPPFGFTYSSKDTALVYLEKPFVKGKVVVTSHKMKVDEAVYDSIQRLHMLAVYTSAQFDPQYTMLDGTRYHFIWAAFLTDKYAISSDNGSHTYKQLASTFESICLAIKNDDYESLYSLVPTIHQLLAHYQTLLLPDAPIDEEEVDATFRHRKNKKDS